MSNQSRLAGGFSVFTQWLILVLAVLILALAVWLAVAGPLPLSLLWTDSAWVGVSPDDLPARLAAVGDYLGGSVGLLFSVASVLLILATLIAQSRALSLQEREVKLLADEIHSQTETQELQRFDSIFFGWLTNIQHSLDSASYGNTQGRFAIQMLAAKVSESQAGTSNQAQIANATKFYSRFGHIARSFCELRMLVLDRAAGEQTSLYLKALDALIMADDAFLLLFYSGLPDCPDEHRSIIAECELQGRAGASYSVALGRMRQ